MITPKPDIVLIGAGNVATHLGIALQEKGFPIVQVYSHTTESAATLGNRLNVLFTADITAINPNAKVYLFAVKDDAVPELLKKIPSNSGLWIHTAGSTPMTVFENYAQRFGVIYPLQTFSKNRPVNFDHIPLFVEANNPTDEIFLCSIAEILSDCVVVLPSEKRKYLHLAAVFACNFTNHMYTLSADILEQQGLTVDLLLPLIQETADKVSTMNPKEAQTGPAVRYDQKVINNHLEILENDKNKQEIYKVISQSIHATNE